MTSGRKPEAKPNAETQVEGDRPEPKEDADGAFVREERTKAPTAAGNGENDSAATVEADLTALLDDTRRERDEYLDLAKRARADFENYRKRAAQQAADAERKAKAALARDLIPAIDNLERALESAPDDDPLSDGVRLVHRELSDALRRAGVEAFDPTGERFDPNSSEALSTQPGDGAEPGTVIESLTRGYRLDGQVIRPARVVVAQ